MNVREKCGKEGEIMTNYELMNKIICCKSKKDIMRLLNKYRVSTNKSKYC